MLNLQVIAKPVLVLWTAEASARPFCWIWRIRSRVTLKILPIQYLKKCSVKNYDKLKQISGKHSPLCLIFSSSSPKSSLS